MNVKKWKGRMKEGIKENKEQNDGKKKGKRR